MRKLEEEQLWFIHPSAQVLQQQLVHHHGLCWTTVCIMLMPQNPEETGEPGSPE